MTIVCLKQAFRLLSQCICILIYAIVAFKLKIFAKVNIVPLARPNVLVYMILPKFEADVSRVGPSSEPVIIDDAQLFC